LHVPEQYHTDVVRKAVDEPALTVNVLILQE
jgi:hypothetical protein